MKRIRWIIPILIAGSMLTKAIITKVKEADQRNPVIHASGTMEATETDISPKIAGRIAQLSLNEGDAVKSGQVIARLDDQDLRAQVAQAQAGVAAAAAHYADLVSGSRPEQIARARANVANANAAAAGATQALLNAEAQYARRTELRSNLDAAKAEERGALANLRAAEARLAELTAGARNQEIDEAEAAYSQAVATRDGARRSLANARQLYEERTQEKQQLDAADTGLELARARETAARAEVVRAEAVQEKAAIDSARMKRLLAEGAASIVQAEEAEIHLKTSQATLVAAQEAVRQASETVVGARKTVANAKEIYGQRTTAQERVSVAQAQLETAQSKVEAAEARLSLVKAGPRSEAIRQGEAAVQQAGARLDGARKAVRNTQELYADRLALKQQVDQARSGQRMAQAQTQAAQSELDLFLAGATEEALQVARAQVDQLKGVLEYAQTQLSHTVIRAPAAGVITVKAAEVGEMVAPGTAIVTVSSLDDVWLRAYLPLPKLGKVMVGQTCQVTADTYPDKAYAGVVIQVSDEPEFTPKTVQTQEERVKLVFSVKVQVENARRELKPGMPAEMTLNTGTAQPQETH